MKKEKSPVLVIFCIFLLSLFVILPPTFRNLFPKQEKSNTQNNQQQQKIVIVNCNKIYPNELYQVNSRTKYITNSDPVNTMSFTKLDVLPENYTPVTETTPTSVLAELTYLKNISDIQYIENQNITTFTLDNIIISSMPEDTKLSSYLADDYATQKQTYESLGYTCNILES